MHVNFRMLGLLGTLVCLPFQSLWCRPVGTESPIAQRYQPVVHELASFAGRFQFCAEQKHAGAKFLEADAVRARRELIGMMVGLDPAYERRRSEIEAVAKQRRGVAREESQKEECATYASMYRTYIVENKLNSWRVRDGVTEGEHGTAGVFWGRSLTPEGSFRAGLVQVEIGPDSNSDETCRVGLVITFDGEPVGDDSLATVPVELAFSDDERMATAMQRNTSPDGATVLRAPQDAAEMAEAESKTARELVDFIAEDNGVVRALIQSAKPFSVEMHAWKRAAALRAVAAGCPSMMESKNKKH